MIDRENDDILLKDEGADFVLDGLAKALGLEHWTQQDGSETWDGDVSATLWHILYDAKVLDPDTNKRAVCEVAGTPRVKALEWRPLRQPVGAFAAQTAFGDYRTSEADEGGYYFFREGGRHYGYFATLELAQAAAQSHYSQAILTALEPEAKP